MGQRSSTETIVLLVQAFLERRTWSQAELARRLEMTTPAVRSRLVELQGTFRLECEKEHPHVYWSVPKDWFPGGVLFTREQLPALLRHLARLPPSKARDALLDTVLRHVPRDASVAGLPSAFFAPPSTASEDLLCIVEDAATRKTALRFRYFTASRGVMTQRHASVHRVTIGRPARFVATCHRSGTLKWFRVENMVDASLDPHEAHRPATAGDVDAFHAASVDGFNAGGDAATLSFVVRDPDARWVLTNLAPPMKGEEIPGGGGIRVTVETNALRQVARFVVGLGAAARAESPALVEAVRHLALGALGD